MLLFLLTAHISFSFVEEHTLAFLCHCSLSSYNVATHHIRCQIQDWGTLSGRRGMRGERRGGIKCEDEEGREVVKYSHHICSLKENFIQQRAGRCREELRAWEWKIHSNTARILRMHFVHTFFVFEPGVVRFSLRERSKLQRLG